jgi:hypothetical protein
MSILYKDKKDQTISVEVEILLDNRIVLEFYSDCGKFGTDEAIGGYVLSPKRLLEIIRLEQSKIKDKEIY